MAKIRTFSCFSKKIGHFFVLPKKCLRSSSVPNSMFLRSLTDFAPTLHRLWYGGRAKKERRSKLGDKGHFISHCSLFPFYFISLIIRPMICIIRKIIVILQQNILTAVPRLCRRFLITCDLGKRIMPLNLFRLQNQSISCIIANKTQEIFIFLPCKKYLTPLFQGTKLGEAPFYVRS